MNKSRPRGVHQKIPNSSLAGLSHKTNAHSQGAVEIPFFQPPLRKAAVALLFGAVLLWVVV